MKDPYPMFFPQRRTSVYRLQREPLACAFEREDITSSQAQLVANLLGNNDAACLIYRNS